MKRSRMLVVVLALLLMTLIPVLASAQSPEKTGSFIIRNRNAPGNPLAGAGIAKATQQLDTAKPVPQAALPSGVAQLLGPAPNTRVGTLLNYKEGFEQVWPFYPEWVSYDADGPYNGEYCWGQNDFISFKGDMSIWPAAGCWDGVDPTYYYYPNDTNSWTDYVMSTMGARKANVNFRYWNQSEYGWDYFYWCASVDYWTWYCDYHTGDTGKWRKGRIDLRNVPGYGSMLNEPAVFIAFGFTSDSIITDDGPFVDDVRFLLWD